MKRSLITTALLELVLFMSMPASAQDTEYRNSSRTYSSDEVLAILGKKKNYGNPQPIRVRARANANLSSSLNCGKMQFDYRFREVQDRILRLPTELRDQATSTARSIVNALPMMALCYTSPTLCAELKNLNLRLDMDLGVQSDICRAMDNYIGDQADKGEKTAKDKAMRKCVSDWTRRGYSVTNAIQKCTNNPPPALTVDIAQAWVTEVAATRPQKVLESLLRASNQQLAGRAGQQNYRFLAAVMGEMQMNVNGRVIPVFPAKVLTPETLGEMMFAESVRVACNPSRFQSAIAGRMPASSPDAEIQFFLERLSETITDNIEAVDHNNLYDLDPPDRDLMCSALGRSLGKVAIYKTAADGESMMATALQNPALPEELRETYRDRMEQVFPAIRAQADAETSMPISQVRQFIARMAALQREQRRTTAKALSKGEMANEQIRQENSLECDSAATCQ